MIDKITFAFDGVRMKIIFNFKTTYTCQKYFFSRWSTTEERLTSGIDDGRHKTNIGGKALWMIC